MSETISHNPMWFSKLRFNWTRKIPIVMQSEASECGIACLTMIANFYGNKLLLRQMRNLLPASQQGLSLQQIIQYAHTLGLSSRALTLALEELSQLQTPAILHWNFSHFVVLTKVTKKHIYISDPAMGERKLSWSHASKSFTGVALELSPNHDFSKVSKTATLSLWDFAKPIRGIKQHIAFLVGLSLLMQVFVLAAPFYMQTVIDKVLLTSSQSMLTVLAMGFGLLLLIESLTQWLRDVVILRFSNLFNLHISSSVLAHLLSLSLAYFQRRHMGDIVSRFHSLQAVREILTQGLVSALIDGVLSIITLVVLFLYSPKLALIVLAVVIIYCITRWALFYPIKQLNQQILQSDAEQQSFFMQSIRAARTIKLANTEAKTQAKWLAYFVDNSNQRIRLGQWNISFSIVNKLLFGFENIIVVYVAATLVMANEFSIGMLFAFMSYKTRFVGACASLIEKWIEYKILNVHLNRIEDIVHQPSEVAFDSESQLSIRTQSKLMHSRSTRETGAELKAEKISFTYHDSQAPLFRDLDLSVSAGDVIAIIGTTGCGKTSLLLCLLGLIAPTEGSITVNQSRLTPNTRSQFTIAAVMQDDQLLNGSVLDNITQFAEKTDFERVIRVAKVACIDNDIMAMTMQYQTLIGDMGSSLSGGQKQRILLARALYQEPHLLVLDEATSHLDIATEALICANLKALKTTIIMVAHRPQTIAIAEKVYTLSSTGLTEISYPNDIIHPSTHN